MLGTAGVVVSGTGYELDSGSDQFTENDTDTGGSSDQEVDSDSDDVGGNTTSDSLSTSETDTDSTTNSNGGTDSSSSTLDLNYGPGQIVTGGTQTDGESDTESTTATVNDSSNDSSTESETDSDLEADDSTTDTISDTEDDSDSDNETDSDSGSSGDDETIIFGANMDELSGSSAASETDTATDSDTNVDSATTTASESSSYSETVGAETTTDRERDSSTETDAVTDTEEDAPTNTEESTMSTGIGGLILSGSSTDTVDDTGTLGKSEGDTDVVTSTETLSDDDNGETSDGASDFEITTSTNSMTETGSDTAPNTLTEVTSQILGVAGVITGGAVESIESGSDSGSWGTTGKGSDTDTNFEVSTEQGADDGSNMTESDQESGSYTSSGGSEHDSTVYESTTETLGDGGLVTCGVVTESTTEGGGSSETVTETDAETDFQAGATGEDRSGSLGDQSEDDGLETGWTTLTDTDNSSSTRTDTLSEALGFDGTVASGNESDALDETSGDTTAETGNPTDTVTDYGSEQLVGSDGLMSMTLTETDSTTDTHNESDNDWATETLGVSGAITGGSDCFTVSDLDASAYNDSGSGPDAYDEGPGGHTTIDTFGSSSNFVYQTLGDTLGTGGAISSGDLSYTDSTSDTDEEATTESLTLPWTSPTEYSYNVTTTIPDNGTAYETGTETLGDGGTIEGGSDSFSWSDGNSTDLDMAVSGISATLNIGEASTEAYGYGESGTATITTGGADSSGSASFDWYQLGTDSYFQNQASSTSVTSPYNDLTNSSLNVTDTVSSSWNDDGVDELTDNDSVTGETDHYTWDEFESLTDTASGTVTDVGGARTRPPSPKVSAWERTARPIRGGTR